MSIATTRSLLLRFFWGMLASSAASTPLMALAADPYPNNPVRLIVPTQPGGSVDIVGRLVAIELSKRLGRQVIVDNRGGAGGIIGVDLAAKANPDGYTLVLANGTQSIQPALQPLPYEPVKSFTPIAKIGIAALALVVHPSIPANSVKELISLAKRKPGELNFVGTGSGAMAHMATELFKIMADINFLIVQFKSAGPGVVDLVGGHSHAMVGTIASVLPHIRSGRLKVLGTSGTRRSVVLPDVPAISEAGLAGYEAVNWYGIFAPAGTSLAIVDRLNRELRVILVSDEMKKMFLNDALEVDYLGPSEFGAFFARDMEQWARVIKRANITLKE